MACTTQPDLARFRAFLTSRGHADTWQDVDLQRALWIVDRIRYPGQPRDGGKFGSGKMSPDTGDGSGAAGTSPIEKTKPDAKRASPIGEAEAKRDYCQGPKETFRPYMLRAGTNFANRLKDAGLPVTVKQGGKYAKPGERRSDSVYLKREKNDFDIRIADHKLDKGTKSTRSTGVRYVLPVEKDAAGRGRIRLTDLNDTLQKIVTRHGT